MFLLYLSEFRHAAVRHSKTISALVGRTEEIVDGLYRIECRDGHFNEYGVPVAHGAVPQAGELHGTQFLAVAGLGGDEACGRIYVGGEIKLLAVDILDVANEVDGIEVGGCGHHLLVLLVFRIHLIALEDLW